MIMSNKPFIITLVMMMLFGGCDKINKPDNPTNSPPVGTTDTSSVSTDINTTEESVSSYYNETTEISSEVTTEISSDESSDASTETTEISLEDTTEEVTTEVSTETTTMETSTESPSETEPATTETSSAEESEETTEAHKHKYDGKITKEATCTANGVKTYTCSCGDTYTEEIAALGHNFRFVNKVEPTYTSTGYELYECSRCKTTEKQNEVPFLINKVTSLSATVVSKTRYIGDSLTAADFVVTAIYEDGSKKTVTSGLYINPTKLTATSNTITLAWAENNITVQTTVTVTAVEKHTHSYTEDKSQYVAPTCTTKGRKVEICSCGSKVTEIAALGHNFVFTNKVPPTTTSEGYDLYTCNRCSATEQRNITAKLPGERTVVGVYATCQSYIYGGVTYNTKDIDYFLAIEYSDGDLEGILSTKTSNDTSWQPSIPTFNIDAGDTVNYTIRWKGQDIPVSVHSECGYSRKIAVRIFEKIQEYRKANGLPENTWNENLYQYVAARSYDCGETSFSHDGNWLTNTECLALNYLAFGQLENINAYVEEVAEDTFQQWKCSPSHNSVLLAPGQGYGSVGCFIYTQGRAVYTYQITSYDAVDRVKQYGKYENYVKYIQTAFSLGKIDHKNFPNLRE